MADFYYDTGKLEGICTWLVSPCTFSTFKQCEGEESVYDSPPVHLWSDANEWS